MPLSESFVFPPIDSSSDGLESLIDNHYQKIFSLVDAFIENPAISLRLTEIVFNLAQVRPAFNTISLYRAAMEAIDFQRHESTLLELMPFPAALCWLLKDLGGFKYDEISRITGMAPLAVKENIASARSILIVRMG